MHKCEVLTQVPFTRVKIKDSFWAPRLTKHQETTIKACLKQCEKTGRIENFEKAAGVKEGDFQGVCFNDSDIYKVIEGIAYSLMNNPNAELEKYTDLVIDKIAAAQEEDGYLDTYFTLGRQDKKWTDMMAHEDYCGGHLIEAAIAYNAATGKRKLLEVAIKMANHYVEVFGDGKRHWTAGHQEIELALVKLYRETKVEKYLKLAQWFIEERGHGHEFKDSVWDRNTFGGAPYNQDDKPIRELSDIKGHAVRAMYYFAAVADLAALTGDKGYTEALDRLWDSTVMRNMYVTGGIGSSKDNEGFNGDYDLPNDTAYCETCASVGMVYWNSRMNKIYSESKYADIVEREIYNGIVSGISLEGDKFFYVNPLESHGDHHRQQWYDVSCCPTQLARFIPSIGDYVYAVSDEGIWVNLYLSSDSSITFQGREVKITQQTSYPWSGSISFLLEVEGEEEFDIKLRFPGWCKSAGVKINNEEINNLSVENGYIQLKSRWKNADKILLELDMPVERVYSNPKVKVNLGKAALQRGPIVYCVEEADNVKDFENIVLHKDAKFIIKHDKELLGGITVITAEYKGEKLTAIPYYAWDNRSPGKMKVWIPEIRNCEVEKLYGLSFNL
jgi:uncharacterized protein